MKYQKKKVTILFQNNFHWIIYKKLHILGFHIKKNDIIDINKHLRYSFLITL